MQEKKEKDKESYTTQIRKAIAFWLENEDSVKSEK